MMSELKEVVIGYMYCLLTFASLRKWAYFRYTMTGDCFIEPSLSVVK